MRHARQDHHHVHDHRVLVDGGYDPTFLVGGELNDLGSNARHGQGEFVVCEADESDGSLLLLRPEVAVLTNLELDHHSHYLHVEDVERVFAEFLGRLPADGLLVYCAEDGRVSCAGASRCPAERARTGSDERADYQAREVVMGHPGSSFEVWNGGRQLAQSHWKCPEGTTS